MNNPYGNPEPQPPIDHLKSRMDPQPNLAIILEVQKKLFEIENKLNAIYDAVHPPLWKSIPKWIMSHIIPITLFVITIISLYKGYQVFIDLKDQFLPLLEAKENLNGIDESIINTIKDLELPF